MDLLEDLFEAPIGLSDTQPHWVADVHLSVPEIGLNVGVVLEELFLLGHLHRPGKHFSAVFVVKIVDGHATPIIV